MADNNSSNNRRNVTGSYPGATGSYRPVYKPTGESDINARSKSVKEGEKKSRPPKKENFDFKLWFSQDNVKGFLKQVAYYGCIIAASVLLTIGIVNVANDIFAFIKPDESHIVSIEQGSSVKTIASALDEAGVIDHPFVFRMYSKLKKADGSYQYGDYTLNSNLGYDQIISKLKKVSVQAETVTITIEEGWTQDDIVDYLTSNDYVSATELDNALNTYDYKEFDFVQNLPKRRCRLEGYLISGEYEISVGESAVSIVSKILTRFKETVLTDTNLAAIETSGMSLDEVITLASLVYKECNSADMYKSAVAVIKNRIASTDNTFLSLTSPINYVLAAPKTVMSSDDKRTASTYNTYIFSGLPTGPICNPSVVAIDATLYPESSAYMYFISDGEKSYFSISLDEHMQNLAKCSDTRKGTNTIE